MSSMLKGEAAAQSSISAFMYRQWFVHPKAVSSGTTLVGQVAIITGSNTGLGLEAARQLLQLNLTRLVIAVRSRFKGDAAAQSLRNEFPKAQIDVWIVDMERYDSILSFVEKCKTLPQIDMVVLNAGVENSTFKLNQTTKHEMSFQVNYLSTMLLAILLLPVLKGKKVQITRPARLCVVTSISACWTELENEGPILKSFDKEEGYATLTWYAREKLLQQLFFAKLADQISPEDVVINFVCPGLVRNTGLSQTPGFGALAIVLFKHTMGRNMQVGASVYVDAVLRGKESHGSFVADWGIRPYPPIMYTKEGEEFQHGLWEETLAELGFADVSKILRDISPQSRS